LSKLTNEGSELNQALERFKTFGDHLVDLTAPDGALTASLENIQQITDQLTQNDNIKVTLQNFRDSSEKLKGVMRDIEPVGKNITEFSSTIKSQPRRLIWPSTKKTPEGAPSPPADQTITVRKSTKPKATPGQSGSR
jgi:hypothetical protein